MKFITLFILTSCTISYFYKGKDLEKSQQKMISQFNKSIKQFDQFNDNNKVFQQLKKAQVDEFFLSNFSSAMKKCYGYKTKIISLRDERINIYKKLGINKKKKYSKKDKKYKEIQKYIDSKKPFQKSANAIFDKANLACKEPNNLLKNQDIKSLDAKVLYAKFQEHKKNLTNTVKKVRSQTSKYKKKVKDSKHKNKKKIYKKLGEINPILVKIEKQTLVLDKHISDLKKEYGKKGPIITMKGTLAHKKIVLLQEQIKSYQYFINQYDKKIKEINKLVKD